MWVLVTYAPATAPPKVALSDTLYCGLLTPPFLGVVHAEMIGRRSLRSSSLPLAATLLIPKLQLKPAPPLDLLLHLP